MANPQSFAEFWATMSPADRAAAVLSTVMPDAAFGIAKADKAATATADKARAAAALEAQAAAREVLSSSVGSLFGPVVIGVREKLDAAGVTGITIALLDAGAVKIQLVGGQAAARKDGSTRDPSSTVKGLVGTSPQKLFEKYAGPAEVELHNLLIAAHEDGYDYQFKRCIYVPAAVADGVISAGTVKFSEPLRAEWAKDGINGPTYRKWVAECEEVAADESEEVDAS